MKKILFITLLFPALLFAQWNGTTNKTVRESDLFGPLFDQALDSADIVGSGTNLEPELVVTPAESKIVMDVDSVGIRGNLEVDNTSNLRGIANLYGGAVFWASPLQGVGMTALSLPVNVSTMDITNSLGYGFRYSNSNFKIGYNAESNELGKSQIKFYADSIIITTKSINIDGTITFNDYTFPPTDGSPGTVMKTDGDGNLYWGSDIYGGGGGSGSDTASVLYHLSRYVTADSFATYAEGLARYQPLESTLTDIADGTIVENLVNTTNPWADNEVANDLTIDATNISSSITRDTEVTKELLGTNGDISDGTITNGDDNTLTTEDDVYDFVIGQGYVLDSGTSAWDKNSSNDRLLADTTGSGGNTVTRYQHLTGLALKVNRADTISFAAGQFVTRYFAEKTYIKDGNTNWNNSYGFITGNQTITLSGQASGSGTTSITVTLPDSFVTASEVSGDTLLGTAETLDSLIRDYWNDNLGGGVIPDSVIYTSELNVNNIKEVKDWEPVIVNGDAIVFNNGDWEIKNIPAMIADSLADIRSRFQSLLDAVAECCDISDNTPPDAVTNLVATPKSTTKDSLTWTATGSEDAAWYRIYRKTTTRDSTTATKIDSVAYGTNYYVNTGLTENTVYWYWIKVVDDSSNVSGWCVGDSAKTFTTGGPTPFYTIDFEENNLNEWTTTSGANISTSSTQKIGNYSMRIGTNSWGRIDSTHASFNNYDSIYVTFEIYLPSADSQSATYNYVSMFDDGDNDKCDFGTNLGAGTAWAEWVAGYNSNFMTQDLTTNFSTNAWRTVKHYYKKGTGANAIHKVFVEGTEIYSVTNADDTDDVYRFTAGSQNATIYTYFYIDDIKFYTEDPD